MCCICRRQYCQRTKWFSLWKIRDFLKKFRKFSKNFFHLQWFSLNKNYVSFDFQYFTLRKIFLKSHNPKFDGVDLRKPPFMTCALVVENKRVVSVLAEFAARFSQVMHGFAISRVICEKSKFVRFRGVSGKCLKLRDLSANAFFANHLRCRMFCDCHIIHTVLSLVTGLMLGW